MGPLLAEGRRVPGVSLAITSLEPNRIWSQKLLAVMWHSSLPHRRRHVVAGMPRKSSQGRLYRMPTNNSLAPKRGRPKSGRRIQPTTVAGRTELRGIRAELRRRISKARRVELVRRRDQIAPYPVKPAESTVAT